MKLNLRQLANTAKKSCKRHAPEILVYSGVLGMAASAVMACFATRKLDGVMEEHGKRLEAVKALPAPEEAKAEEVANEAPRALTGAYLKTGLDIVLLYAPSAILGALSAAGILTGNHILQKRNLALAAAYATIDASYRQYRGRVSARYGEEAENQLYNNLHTETVIVTETDENGEEKKVEKNLLVLEDAPSDYARIFAPGEAKSAEESMDYNMFFLRSQQTLANVMLKSNGFLSLNDVYDMLGITRSIAGQTVGWVYDKESEDHGDNYVDFGIQTISRKRSPAPGDYEEVILLNFNVDGDILSHALHKELMVP